MSVLRTAYVNVLPKTDQFDSDLKQKLRRIDASREGNRVGKTFSDGMGRTLGSAGGAAGTGFGQNFTKQGGGVISRGFSSLKSQLGPLLIPAGIGAAVGAIGKIGMAYEDSLNIFQSVTRATGGQMDQIAAKARALGADVTLPGVSAAGAAEAMTELAKAGFTVQEAMDGATGTLRLARAAGIGEAQAATIAATAVNAFGINARDVAFVADELAAAANSSSVEVTDMADAFKMAGSVFSSFQAPAVGSKEAITELNTAVAILGNNGIRGSDAGTSLKQMLLQLTGPTQAAKAQMQLLAQTAAGANIPLALQNQVLHGGAKARGEAAAQIAKLNPALANTGDIAFDASGKMRALPQIIDLVTRGTRNMTQEERAFAITQIFGADASRSVIALMKGGLPTYEAQRKAVLQQGAAADVAAAKNKGLRGAIDNVRSQLENAAISIYSAVKGPLTTGLNGLANILAPLAGHIATFAGFISRNIGTLRDWAVAIGVVTLALRLNSTMLAIQAAGGIAGWIRMIRPVASATRLWAGAQTLLNATLIANPIGIVIVALAAFVAAVVLAYRHSETFRNFVDKLGRSIVTAWGQMRAVIGAVSSWFTGTITPSIGRAISQAVSLWNFLKTVVRIVWQSLQQTISIYWTIIRAVFVAIRSWLTIVWTAFTTFGRIGVLAWRTLSAGIAAIWTSIRTGSFAPLRAFITQTLPNAFRTGVGAIAAAWDRVREAARVPVTFVVRSIINPLIAGFNRVSGIFNGPHVDPIAGFARGGRIPGAASVRDNRLAAGPAGPLAVASGEFITNARSTMANLPLIAAINNKRGKVSRQDVDPYLDGAARGGLIGDGIGDFFGRVWNGLKGAASFVADPVAGLKRIAAAMLDRIPGGGAIAGVLRGMGRRLVDGLAGWLGSNAGGGGALGGAGVGGGWRAMRALIAGRFPGLGMISGFRPGARTLSGNQSYHALGRAVDYPPVRALAAWIRGTYGARTKELISPWNDLNLWNGRPHRYTGAVWNQHNFAGGNAHVHWAMANGGVIREPVFGVGRSGRSYSFGERGPETVTPGTGGTVHVHFHNSVITSKQLAEDLVVEAVQAAKRKRRLT